MSDTDLRPALGQSRPQLKGLKTMRYTKEWKRKIVESAKRRRPKSQKRVEVYRPSLQEAMDLWADCK